MPNVTKPLTHSYWLESCSLHIGYNNEKLLVSENHTRYNLKFMEYIVYEATFYSE